MTLSLIIVGVVVLLLGVLHEVRTKRDALFPPIAFKDRTICTCTRGAPHFWGSVSVSDVLLPPK